MPTIAANPSVRCRQLHTPVRRRQAPHHTHRRRATDTPVADDSIVTRTRAWVTARRPAGLVDGFVSRGIWVPFLVLSLLGIVGLQLLTLSVNAGIGRTVDRATVLERENTTLAAEVSRLESADRLDKAVAGMGLVDPVPGSTRYMRADGQLITDAGAPQATPESLTAAATPQDAGSTAAAPAVTAPQTAPAPAQQAPAAPAPAPQTQAATPTPTAPQSQAPATAQQPAATGGAGAPVAPTAAVSVP